MHGGYEAPDEPLGPPGIVDDPLPRVLLVLHVRAPPLEFGHLHLHHHPSHDRLGSLRRPRVAEPRPKDADLPAHVHALVPCLDLRRRPLHVPLILHLRHELHPPLYPPHKTVVQHLPKNLERPLAPRLPLAERLELLHHDARQQKARARLHLDNLIEPLLLARLPEPFPVLKELVLRAPHQPHHKLAHLLLLLVLQKVAPVLHPDAHAAATEAVQRLPDALRHRRQLQPALAVAENALLNARTDAGLEHAEGEHLRRLLFAQEDALRLRLDPPEVPPPHALRHDRAFQLGDKRRPQLVRVPSHEHVSRLVAEAVEREGAHCRLRGARQVVGEVGVPCESQPVLLGPVHGVEPPQDLVIRVGGEDEVVLARMERRLTDPDTDVPVPVLHRRVLAPEPRHGLNEAVVELRVRRERHGVVALELEDARCLKQHGLLVVPERRVVHHERPEAQRVVVLLQRRVLAHHSGDAR